MTVDEEMAELYRRQGFLVMGSQIEHGVGEIERISGDGGLAETRVIVQGPSNQVEFDAQDRLATLITGRRQYPYPIPYFYRVVAAD